MRTHKVVDIDTGKIICYLPLEKGGAMPTYRAMVVPIDEPDSRGRTTHETDKPHTCPLCEGTGQMRNEGFVMVDCFRCEGTGQV